MKVKIITLSSSVNEIGKQARLIWGNLGSWDYVSLAVHLSGIRMLQSWEMGNWLCPGPAQVSGCRLLGERLVPCQNTGQCVVQRGLMHQF